MDTNFLIALAQIPNFNLSFELDRVIPGNRKLIVLKPILSELQKLNQEGNPKVQLESRFALEFVDKNCQHWSTQFNHRNIDFTLLKYGEEKKGIIATNDRQLKRLARRKGIKVLFIRNRRYLELI